MRRPRLYFPAFCALAFVAACAEFPELDAAVSDRAKEADYPTLIPAEQIAERREANTRLREGDGEALLARADRLRQRGEILRRLPIIDEATRVRISGILRRLGG